jgi:hypothetical protein
MASVYLFRHQHHGILTTHVFAERPTAEQVAPLRAYCERLHGAGWDSIHEATMVAPGEVPSIDMPPSVDSSENKSAMQLFSVSGTGTVTPPKE